MGLRLLVIIDAVVLPEFVLAEHASACLLLSDHLFLFRLNKLLRLWLRLRAVVAVDHLLAHKQLLFHLLHLFLLRLHYLGLLMKHLLGEERRVLLIIPVRHNWGVFL